MVEDLSTYTLVDPHFHISTLTPGRVYMLVNKDEDAYLYKDFGVDNFNRIKLDFEGEIGVWSTHGGSGYMGFSNVVDDVSGWTDKIYVWLAESTNSDAWSIGVASKSANDYYMINSDTPYYLSLLRAADSDTATLKIYSDSARSNLLDTLSVNGIGTSTRFRYFYAAASLDLDYAPYEVQCWFQNYLFKTAKSGGGAQIIGLSSW